MFHDVLLETTPQERRRRKLTLGITLLGESLVIAVLVGVPLLYLDALPGLSVHEPRYAVPLGETPHIGGSTTPQPGGATHPTNSIAIIRTLNTHPALTYARQQIASTGSGPGGPTDIGLCCGDPNLPYLPGNTYVPPVPQPPRTEGPRQISHIEEGMILKRVDPVYPQTARIAGVQGEVTLRATIGTSGQLEGLQVVNGNPLLVRAALQAVEQWRFKPYMLNGSPIEVQSQITVKFVLQH